MALFGEKAGEMGVTIESPAVMPDPVHLFVQAPPVPAPHFTQGQLTRHASWARHARRWCHRFPLCGGEAMRAHLSVTFGKLCLASPGMISAANDGVALHVPPGRNRAPSALAARDRHGRSDRESWPGPARTIRWDGGKDIRAPGMKKPLAKRKQTERFAHFTEPGSQAVQDVAERRDRPCQRFSSGSRRVRGGVAGRRRSKRLRWTGASP
jgi:hypothetical protein